MPPTDRLTSLSTHISPPPKITLTRLLWVSYHHTDIPSALKFYADFGLTLLPRAPSHPPNTFYLRGYGPTPFCLRAISAPTNAFDGAAFLVASHSALETAAATLPSATPVHKFEGPGGGYIVTFKDPVDGFPFHLIHGHTKVPVESPDFPALKYNYPEEKKRPTLQKQRFTKRPAPVFKLGHFGVCTTDFDKTYAFYTSRFNFFPSELVYEPATKKNVTTFLRLDLGPDTPVDHHCFFFYGGPTFHVHHSSFETHDFDAQVLGHDWLRDQGYKPCWGVGRHIMGSQVFDYWFDTSGFIVEHYVDGDMLDSTEPTQHTEAGPGNLHVWGPDVPPTFLT